MFTDLTLFYKVLKGLVPIEMPDYIVTGSGRASSEEAPLYKLNLDTLSKQKNFFTRSFFPRCISSWNGLPLEVRSAPTIDSFQCSLKAWIWQSVSSWALELDPDPPDWALPDTFLLGFPEQLVGDGLGLSTIMLCLGCSVCLPVCVSCLYSGCSLIFNKVWYWLSNL